MRVILKDAFYVVLFAVLTAVGAAIKIPFLPYHPITPQVIFVLLSGIILGSFKGPLSQLLFVALGLLGLPLFRELAPSFPVPSLGSSPEFIRTVLKAGWLQGFIAASYIAGITVEYARKVDFWTIFTAMYGGLLVLYLLGILLPVLVLNIPLTPRFLGWAWPFFIMDCLKALLALVFLLNFEKIKKFSAQTLL